jgi:hypothetical protein
MENPLESADTSRRDVLRKAVFVTPVIVSLPVLPSFAKAGSNVEQDDPSDGNSSSSSGDPDSQRRRRRRNHWWFFNLVIGASGLSKV